MWPVVRAGVVGAYLTAELLASGSLQAAAATGFLAGCARAALRPSLQPPQVRAAAPPSSLAVQAGQSSLRMYELVQPPLRTCLQALISCPSVRAMCAASVLACAAEAHTLLSSEAKLW